VSVYIFVVPTHKLPNSLLTDKSEPAANFEGTVQIAHTLTALLKEFCQCASVADGSRQNAHGFNLIQSRLFSLISAPALVQWLLKRNFHNRKERSNFLSGNEAIAESRDGKAVFLEQAPNFFSTS
jgi:hypothetical protein